MKKKKLQLKTLWSSRSRNEALHAHFPAVEETEEVVAVFRCAYSKDILHQGKLYITPRRFYFRSNIFGFEDKVTMDCQNVTAIARAKAALIFPTAILVRCGDTKYLFASFLNREPAYRLMFRVWQSVLIGTVLTVEELTQSKKYHYRRLEHDIKPDGSPELTRSKSADEGVTTVFSEVFHGQVGAEVGHRRTKSDGSSMSPIERPDGFTETKVPHVGPRIRKCISALEFRRPVADSVVGQQSQASALPVKKPRVIFDVKEASDTELMGRVTPITEGESSKIDLSSDPKQPMDSSPEVVKRKKNGKLTKWLHLHYAQSVEGVIHEGSPSHVEKALGSALSLGFSAVPCALSTRGALWPFPAARRVSSTGLEEQKEPEEAQTQGGADSRAEPSASEISFRSKLKRIPIEISSRVSVLLKSIEVRVRSLSGLTLLMALALVIFVLVCISTVFVACQLASVDPVFATVQPLTFFCHSYGFQQRSLVYKSSDAHSRDVTIDKLAAHLKDFDKPGFESLHSIRPSPDSRILRSMSDPVSKSVSAPSESIAETHD